MPPLAPKKASVAAYTVAEVCESPSRITQEAKVVDPCSPPYSSWVWRMFSGAGCSQAGHDFNTGDVEATAL